MPDGGAEEAALTADYNAEMLEQRARFRRLRDRSVFVGNAEDVVPDRFGPGLPGIRTWTAEHVRLRRLRHRLRPGGVRRTGEALRAGLGVPADEPSCVVTVGGPGSGEPLLRRVLDAVPLARRRPAGAAFRAW